jgi:ribosomal protein S18 acetylase RimI-like enzyme
MYLEVRPSNLAGIALYKSHGFVVIGSRPEYYSAGRSPGTAAAGSTARETADREDALVMRLELQS